MTSEQCVERALELLNKAEAFALVTKNEKALAKIAKIYLLIAKEIKND